jgi:hypothetical protein
MTDKKTRGRLTLLLISAVFFAPIFLAIYLYFSDNPWRPSETIQLGTLVMPPVQLPNETLGADQGEFSFNEVWSLIVLAKDECDAACMTALEDIRQIRLSLGPKMPRVQTVFLPAGAAANVQLDPGVFPKMIVADPTAAAVVHERVAEWQNGQIFLVDPFGNLMMSYAPGADKGDVRKDLGHLLQLSEIG